jgi:alpha-L-rhamnosidase
MTNQKSFKISFTGYAVFILVFLLNSACTGKRSNSLTDYNLKVKDLKCEFATNPLGIDVLYPQFSWKIESEKRDISQSAYQVIVTDSPMDSETKSVIWDSGKIHSSLSTGLIYAGPRLYSRNRYYWKVIIWDSNNKSAVSGETAYFEMGLLNQEDWEAEWIGRTSIWTGRVVYYRCGFSVEKPIQKARVYLSGVGLHELHLNGKKVGDHVLDPNVSSFNKRILYVTYDITDLLKKRNVFGVIVGPGFYGIPKLRLQAEIFFTDGTVKKILTNKVLMNAEYSWTVSTGPIISSSLYDGELYDAREEKPGWDSVGPARINDRNNTWVIYLDPPGGKMVSQKLEPIKVVDTIIPVTISEPVAGTYVLDVGQNVAGWAAIKVKGKRGTGISLKFAETLYDNGTVNQENLAMALAEDKYVLNGTGEEYWEPTFTYHGFRYVQLEGFPYRPKTSDILIKVVRSAVDKTGNFTCSNDLLNRIHNMVVSTEAGNLHGIPTDCPQRSERMGWLNDLTVRIEQALYNFNLPRFYAKFIEDIGDTQKPNGSISDTAPFKGGTNPACPVSASYLLLALKSYEFYGNEMIIRRNYENMKAWVDYLYSRTEDGILNYSNWGDWSPPIEFGINSGPRSKNTPGDFMSTGYFYYSCHLISQMARIIDNTKDKIYYLKLAEKSAKAFNDKYWNEQTGGYGSNNQACNSFALFLGLVDKNRVPRVVENLVNDVKIHDYHLTTGNLCTKYLLEMLTEHGHQEVAYKIATRETYPSWGYMLAKGATTLWERWEYATGSGMNSHNHPMMGSVDSWFYKYLVGIIPDDKVPGFERFNIHPYIINDLDFVEGEYNSVKGLIKSSWRKEQDVITMDVTIPVNSKATVFIPAKNYKSITESNLPVDKLEGISFLRLENNYAVFQVGSGTYHFKSDW